MTAYSGSQLGPPLDGMKVITRLSSYPLTMLIDGSVLGDALVAKSSALTQEAAAMVLGKLLDCRGATRFRAYFAGSNAADEAFNYQFHLWFEARNMLTTATGFAFWPEMAASGLVTLGAKTYGSGGLGLGAAGNLIADTITDTVAKPYTVVTSPADDTQAHIEISLDNASFVQVETDLTTAASADVLGQLG